MRTLQKVKVDPELVRGLSSSRELSGLLELLAVGSTVEQWVHDHSEEYQVELLSEPPQS